MAIRSLWWKCGVLIASAALAAMAGRPSPSPPLSTTATDLSATATQQQVQHLTFSEDAEALDGIHLIANEVWDDAEHPARSDFETDMVSFYRSVHIESMQTEKGKPLDASALAHQASAVQALERRVDALAVGPASAGRLVNLDGEIWTLGQIASHYAWTATPAGIVAGRVAVTLHFAPLPALHPHSRIERVLDDTAGNLTIDVQTGQMLYGDFRSLSEVRYGGGLLAHIAFSGAFTMQAAGGCWVMRDIHVDVQGRELFSRLNGTQVNTYRLMPSAPVAAPLPRQ